MDVIRIPAVTPTNAPTPLTFGGANGCGSIWADCDVNPAALQAPNVVITDFIAATNGVALSLLDTKTGPQAAMALWLKEQEPPAGFSIDRECELKAPDETKAVVRYARHPLDSEEVQGHIEAGKLPTKLAMSWDDRVSFVLTEGLQLKKVAFLDTEFEGQTQDDGGFAADVAIATGELSQLIPDLIAALGGEGRTSLGGAAAAPATPAGA